jgi:hypothetical protein
MKIKFQIFCATCFLLLTSCGGVTPVFTPTATHTITPAYTPTPGLPFQYTVTANDTNCISLAETFMVSVESIIELNNLASSCLISENQVLWIPYSSALPERPSPTPYSTRVYERFPKFSLSGYVMVFSKYDEIYFQNGNHAPVKIDKFDNFNDGKVEILALSDDNQKAIFHTDREVELIRSVNMDGTGEDNLFFPLDQVESGAKLGAVTFIPGTHQLIIESLVCKWEELHTPCYASLFLANTDTDEVNKIAYLGLADQKNTHNLRTLPENMAISPNGKMIAVGTLSGINIYGLDGEVIRGNILPYSPSYSTYGESDLFPRLSWLPDSEELIIGFPNTIYGDTDPYIKSAVTVWRYEIASDNLIPVNLDPLRRNYFKISSDGNWLLYLNSKESWISRINLLDGRTQNSNQRMEMLYSNSFITEDDQYFILSVEGTSLVQSFDFTGSQSEFTHVCWIRYRLDDHHYICDLRSGETGVVEIDSEKITTYELDLNKNISSYFIKLK